MWMRWVINMNTPSGRPHCKLVSILDLIWLTAGPAVPPTWEWPWTEAVSVIAVLPQPARDNWERRAKRPHLLSHTVSTESDDSSLYGCVACSVWWLVNHYHVEFETLYIYFNHLFFDVTWNKGTVTTLISWPYCPCLCGCSQLDKMLTGSSSKHSGSKSSF